MSIMLGMMSLMFILNWEVIMMGFSFIMLMAISKMNIFFNYSDSYFFLDESMSNIMVMLSVFLILVSFLSTCYLKNKKYFLLLCLLGLILYMAFKVNNLVYFYVFFEMSLIPTLILILGWGYQPERLQAGMYMMLYTVGLSLPLLLLILYYNMNNLSSFMYMLMIINNSTSYMVSLILVMAFLVKLPMYSFHLWLPKAHVEAPLAGSMILAGILLKLGGYGLYLMYKLFMMYSSCYINYFIMILSLWGGLLATFMCMRQSDVKALVAYSSVAHMSLIVVNSMLNTQWGLSSMKIILFSHGITSPCLFLLAYITYIKSGSRSLLHSGGMMVIYPKLSLMWFLVLSVNMAAPPTLNLMGELFVMPVLYMVNYFLVVIMMMMMLFSAIYNMYLYVSINHGGSNKLNLPKLNLKSQDYLSVLSLMLPLLFIFKMNMFI